MNRYAYITGDRFTKFEPIVFVQNGEQYEVLCSSFDRKKDWYTFLENNPQPSFDAFLTRFSYQNIDTGEVTAEVESMLNKLRARFALAHIADEEIGNQEEERENPDRNTEQALLKISKRMRTGNNESQ